MRNIIKVLIKKNQEAQIKTIGGTHWNSKRQFVGTFRPKLRNITNQCMLKNGL